MICEFLAFTSILAHKTMFTPKWCIDRKYFEDHHQSSS